MTIVSPQRSTELRRPVAIQSHLASYLDANAVAGPDQTNTAFESLAFLRQPYRGMERRRSDVVASYDIGTENIANRQGSPKSIRDRRGRRGPVACGGPWMAVRTGSLLGSKWSLDRSEQFVKAITSTVEYRLPYKWTNTIVRLEHRWDESTGAGGGFFKGGEIQPGVIGLTPNQHLLLVGILWTFDSP